MEGEEENPKWEVGFGKECSGVCFGPILFRPCILSILICTNGPEFGIGTVSERWDELGIHKLGRP